MERIREQNLKYCNVMQYFTQIIVRGTICPDLILIFIFAISLIQRDAGRTDNIGGHYIVSGNPSLAFLMFPPCCRPPRSTIDFLPTSKCSHYFRECNSLCSFKVVLFVVQTQIRRNVFEAIKNAPSLWLAGVIKWHILILVCITYLLWTRLCPDLFSLNFLGSVCVYYIKQ